VAITTLADVKIILDITDTSKDAIITKYIPLIEQQYLDIRNCPWDIDPLTDDIEYPIGSDITAAEMIGYKLATSNKGKYKEVASESLDAHSISYVANSSGGYPKSITSAIKRFINGA
jgi:hypothetical protein